MAKQMQQTSDQIITMENALSEFSVTLYRVLSGVDNGNAFVSPFSVSSALMLTMLGTRGPSETQLKSVLNLSDIPTSNIHEEFKKLYDFLLSKSGENVQLSVANRVFAKIGLEIADGYKVNSAKCYDSELEMLDFVGNSESSRTRINTWVEEKTNAKIKDLIPVGGINAMSRVVLTNAIYFKGDWARQFKPENTTKVPFFVSETEKKDVDMMHMKKDTFLSGDVEKFDCKVLLLPYKENKLSMVFVLPNKVAGLSELENQLSFQVLCDIESNAVRQDTIIAIPKFKMETTYQLEKHLPNMGLTDIFSPTTADFSGMFRDNSETMFVSNVIHKAFVEVNEEGTEAAAATAIMIRALCIPLPPLEFKADRPFLFYIKENGKNTILFMGRYTQPTE